MRALALASLLTLAACDGRPSMFCERHPAMVRTTARASELRQEIATEARGMALSDARSTDTEPEKAFRRAVNDQAEATKALAVAAPGDLRRTAGALRAATDAYASAILSADDLHHPTEGDVERMLAAQSIEARSARATLDAAAQERC